MANVISTFSSNKGEFEFNALKFTNNIATLIRKSQRHSLWKVLEAVNADYVRIETITPKGRLYVIVVTKRGNELRGSIGLGGKISQLQATI
jgi:hypothetical protein